MCTKFKYTNEGGRIKRPLFTRVALLFHRGKARAGAGWMLACAGLPEPSLSLPAGDCLPWQKAKKSGGARPNRPPTPSKKSHFRFGACRAESLYSPNTLIISRNFDPRSIPVMSQARVYILIPFCKICLTLSHLTGLHIEKIC